MEVEIGAEGNRPRVDGQAAPRPAPRVHSRATAAASFHCRPSRPLPAPSCAPVSESANPPACRAVRPYARRSDIGSSLRGRRRYLAADARDLVDRAPLRPPTGPELPEDLDDDRDVVLESSPGDAALASHRVKDSTPLTAPPCLAPARIPIARLWGRGRLKGRPWAWGCPKGASEGRHRDCAWWPGGAGRVSGRVEWE